MDIIVVSNSRGKSWRLKLAPRHVLSWLPLVLISALFSAAVFYGGYWIRGQQSVLPTGLVAEWAREVATQRDQLAIAREQGEQNASALARRIALLQAHVTRLDAAGKRLTEVAGLEAGEFDFDALPPLGGPEGMVSQESALEQALVSLDAFEQQLSDRERQMRVLEDLLLASRLQSQVKPAGWPIEGGWISSSYGMRTDPFTGRYAMHEGVDFAARAGSPVQAVGAGIVTEASTRYGYGSLVELNHGNGFVTRYGHNDRLLVKVGDKVFKGQRIATIGSSGRSTGPHVHFEVLFNGRVVNPEQYIQAVR